MKTVREFGPTKPRWPGLLADLVTGPFSKEERKNALYMRTLSLTDGYIAEQLKRSVKSVSAFFGAYDRHNAAVASAALAARPATIERAAPVPELAAENVEERDMEIIAPLWVKGLAALAILDRVNRARRSAGRAAMDMEQLHRLVIKHKLARPELARPKMLLPT